MRPGATFGVFSAGSKTTLSCAYPWPELYQTRFLGLLQAILPESSVRNGKIPVLADYPNFAPWSNFWRFFGRLQDDAVLRLPLDRITPNSVSCVFAGHSTWIERWKREDTIISRLARFWRFFGGFSAGSKTTLSCAYPWPELYQTRFLGLLQAILPESSVRNGKIPVLADYPNFAPWSNFWRFFGRLQDDAVLRLPLDRITPNSVSCVFAGHSTWIERWKREDTIISRLAGFWRFFGGFSAGSKTTLSCAYPWPELYQTRFLGLLQAILPESSVRNGKIPVLADYPNFAPWSNFWRFFGRLQDDAVLRLPLDRITPNSVSCVFAGHSTWIERWKREDTIISRLAGFWRFFAGFSAGSKTTLSCAYPWPELYQTRFLGLLQAILPESSVRNGKIPVLADYPNFAPWSNFWRFFGRLQDDAVLRLPLDRITPNSVSCVFAGHSTWIERWKREDTIISRLARFWRFFGGFSAGSKTTLSCAYPWPELYQTRFLGLLQAMLPESSVRNGKIPVLADYPNFAPWSNFWRFFGRLQDDAVLRLPLDRITPNSVSCVFAGHSTWIERWKREDTIISRLAGFWRFFGGFSAGSKTTLSCAYPWPELYQTRFLGLLQAILPESSVRNGKIPVLADYPNFAPWSNFWRFFGRLQDDAVLRLPLDRITPNSVSCVFAGHSTLIERWKREDTIISRLAGFWRFFGGFSAGSKTTLSCAYPWPELYQTRFLGLLQAILPESSVRNGKIPVLADYPNFAPWSNFWRFFGRLQDDAVLRLPLDRITPNSVSCVFAGHSTWIERWKREDTIISRLAGFWPFFGGFSAGSKTTLSCAYPWPELYQTRFLGLLQAILPESSVRNGKIPVLADYPNFAPWSNFWRFFGRLQDDAVLRLPLDRITPNSVSCVFAGHSTWIERWKREDTIISRLAGFWRFFGGFSAGSKTTLSCAYPWPELYQTRFLGLLQAILPESSVRNGKIPVLADYPNFAPWTTFGVFSAGSKTTLSCAYLWTELHQTRFPVCLQAIPP